MNIGVPRISNLEFARRRACPFGLLPRVITIHFNNTVEFSEDIHQDLVRHNTEKDELKNDK